jgi:hypothetical protein
VPEISRFFGIIIAMFYNDHPPPHFHVRHGGDRATIGIEDLACSMENFHQQFSDSSLSGRRSTGWNC